MDSELMPQNIYCYNCTKTSRINISMMTCPICGNDFIEEISQPIIHYDPMEVESNSSYSQSSDDSDSSDDLSDSMYIYPDVVSPFHEDYSDSDSYESYDLGYPGFQIRGHQYQNYKHKGTLLEITMSLVDNTCSICLESLEIGKSGKILKCSHIFHPECIDR